MKKILILSIVAALGMAACTTDRISSLPSYKLRVIQGNELDPDAVVQLRKGLTREEVQMILGTPLLKDPFHQNRWDYVFAVTKNGRVKESSSLTLYFDAEGRLAGAEGDALQKARDAVAERQAVAASAASENAQ